MSIQDQCEKSGLAAKMRKGTNVLNREIGKRLHFLNFLDLRSSIFWLDGCAFVLPFQGKRSLGAFSQGVALGYHVSGFQPFLPSSIFHLLPYVCFIPQGLVVL